MVLMPRYLYVEHVPDRIGLRSVNEFLEKAETLPLILDQRVALTHGTQTDTGSQVIHLSEMLAPLVVDHREHDGAFERTHHL